MFNHTPSRLGLTWFRAYDPNVGRWVSRDPLGEMTDPAGNLYAYVGNAPLSKVDLLGLAEIPNPNGVVPGGPWVPKPGGRDGRFMGPKPPDGPRQECQWVPRSEDGF